MAQSKQIKWINSIQTRIVFITIFIVTLVLGTSAAYTYWISQTKLTDELIQLSEATSGRLASHLVKPLWDLDVEQVEKSINAEMKEQRIYGIIIRDSDGQTIFAGTKRDPNWQPTKLGQIQFASKDLIMSRQQISNGSESVGVAEVYLTSIFLNEQLNKDFARMALQLIVLDLIIFLAIFAALKSMVIVPIAHLAAAAEAMSKGNFNVKINLSTNNEIGQVADAMERMKTSLKMAMTKMRSQLATQDHQ